MTRKQHDNFSKRFLPEWVKANSEVFLEMNGQERHDLLFQLWNSAQDGPALEPLGLKVLEIIKTGHKISLSYECLRLMSPMKPFL